MADNEGKLAVVGENGADVQRPTTSSKGDTTPAVDAPDEARLKAVNSSTRRTSRQHLQRRGSGLGTNDAMKMQQQKAAASKEAKRARLDARHKWIIQKVAETLEIEEPAAEDFCLEGKQIDAFDDFLKQNGARKLLFYYQEAEEGNEKDLRPGTGHKTKARRLFVTNGRVEALSGTCVYFVRTTTKAITPQNMAQEINFNFIDSSGGDGILESLERTLANVLLPSLKTQDNWGDLSQNKHELLNEFLESLDKFVSILAGARANLADSVQLKRPEGIDLDTMQTPADYINAANSTETVDALEELVSHWCKQIEQVLAESEQMRKEADDIGPKAELEHWKQRMAKFNSLLDQIKSPMCKAVVGVLHAAKSRLLKAWKDLDNRITDAANEAKDNVKYLYTLEKFCEPLYKSNPVDMESSIPGLINAIRMIHSISRYYNTSERMTSLFVKITNQMITACKNYVYQDGSKIWEQERKPLIQRLNECVRLNEDYQRSFQRVKAKLQENPNERQFDFSEMYIFGKFDTFCKRIQKVVEMLNTIEKFSALANSRIEGMENILTRFNQIVITMKNKPYDILDHRKMDFDTDYEVFKRDISDLELQLQRFMDSCFDRITSTELALELLQKFESIENLNLDLEDKYMKIFLHYGKDLEVIRKIYQKNKDNPPIPRNLPPVSGCISWARQLFRRIENPMRAFQKRPSILQGVEGRKIIRNYNKLASVLMEFEMLYHRGWYKMVEAAKTGLHATLLVRHPDTEQLYVNFDPDILQLIRETKCMQRMELEIPEAARVLCVKEDRIKRNFNRLQHMLNEHKRITAKIPDIFTSLMSLYITRVAEALEPGLTMLTWTSLNLESYLDTIHRCLGQLEELTDKVNDIRECRIEALLRDMSTTCLVDIPGDEPWTVEEFLERTESLCDATAKTLDKQSSLVEKAANDLVRALTKQMTTEQKELAQNECRELLLYFNQKNLEALVKCTRLSLDTIKRRLAMPASGVERFSRSQSSKDGPLVPFFKAQIALAIPNVVMRPGLDDIQQALNKAAQTILNVSKAVYQWNQDRAAANPEAVLRNYFSEVSNNKDIVKIVMMLTSTINSTKKDITGLLDGLSKYNTVWQEDRDEKMRHFLEKQPTLSDFEGEIHRYEDIEQEVNELPAHFNIGAMELTTEPLKLALTSETKAWKQVYGQNLNLKAKQDMEEVINFVSDVSKRLSRKIKDLDDVRQTMAALSELREMEIKIEMSIAPIEEAYAMLSKFNVLVSKEETERVDTLRYNWQKLRAQASDVQDSLIRMEPGFKNDLMQSVEQFVVTVGSFGDDYQTQGPIVAGIKPKEASERLNVFQRRFEELWRKYETYSAGEELFGLTVTDYPELQRIKKELRLLQSLYTLYNAVIDGVNGYYDVLWVDINIDKINSELQEYQNKCRKLPKALKDWEAYLDLKRTIDDFCETLPLMELMANKAMQTRHWDKIAQITGHTFKIDSESFYLRNLMEAPLLKHKEDIEDVCIAAVKERDIEAKLRMVISDWSTREFTFSSFKNRGNLLLKGSDTSDIVMLMEDSLMILGSLMSNRYNAPFKPEIQQWVQKLTLATEIIENWLHVQNLWIYLEAVFVGGDIAKQLPKEAKRFSNIDKSWVKIMTRANENPNVIQCCVGDETLGNLLPHLAEQLEVCQKSLSGYLEKKRAVFPRFYFVSDPALLEILGQASDSHSIQNHLLSVFDNVKKVTFHEKEYDRILSMSSRENETVDFTVPMIAVGNVEIWLGTLLKAMQTAINDIARDAAIATGEPSFSLEGFLNRYPAQVGLLGLQMIWTRDSEEALTLARTDKKIMQTTNQRFLDMLNLLIDTTTRDLTPMDRTKFETLITIHVHQRDIFDNLVKLHVKAPNDFEWLKQTRFYWREDLDTTVVSITDVDFKYQNEFLGCTDRLVITPLTDRCYITLAQALGMCMGGAPAGPAGTGKTETVKDMGRSLGKFVVVFNCSDQMDYRGLGRIYKGLAQSGSWGCFDEFNRIELPVLSVAAQQIACVLTGKKERRADFTFTDGDTVEMNPEFGIFLTMNPGYAGRQELPENLKVQFRSVAMMVPDRQIIIRVKLASCGFQSNVILARKFFVLYRLCEEQLSKQRHYDFGLRNILSVLRTLGPVKRANPEESENTIMMRVLRDMNMSKLVDEDEPLFLSLINDLFPGLTIQKASYPELEVAIEHQVKEAGLIAHPPWFLKVIQLYETQRVRHGIMVLGPPGAGKTRCIHTLMKAMTEVGDSHKEYRMNPKSITAPQMFGRLDVATNDWTDGIFSALWRKTLKMKKSEHIWIVLDGPVDAIWIENLNSVLDDNKTLTLANGDRISMAPNCKLVFEVHSLANASPATVSRNGMIYMSSSALDWKPILQAWVDTRKGGEGEKLKGQFEVIFDQAYTFVMQSTKMKMEVLQVNIIQQALDLLSGLLSDGENYSDAFLEKTFVFALIWSLGALLEIDDRKKLEEFLKKKEGQLALPSLTDAADSIFDYVVAPNGEWEHWSRRLPAYAYPTDFKPEYYSIVVPTVDNVRTDFLIQTVAKQHKHVLLIGEQGTAKTVMVKGYMNRYDPESHVTKSMNFSSATTPLIYQRTIESYVDKRMGNTYGPPAGKKMTVFIDDVNMPEINEWGDQVTNEIVRQLIEQRGLYSLEKPGDFTNIVDLQFICAMIHPGGGRNDIPARLKRHFSIFNCTLPSNASMDKIFGTLAAYFCPERQFEKSVVELANKLVPLTRRLWQATKVKMLPTPAKFHYIFNLRDLSRIWEGMLKVESSVISSVDQVVHLWRHECSRVIADRFTEVKDLEWFEKTMVRFVQEEYGDELAHTCKAEQYFVDFLRDAPEPTGEEGDDHVIETPKVYEPIPSFEVLSERLQQFMAEYNEAIRGAHMDLVFFKDAMIHLVKISRVIRTPRGNALLVGVGGSGKQSLTRLASFIAGYEAFQITLTRSYNVQNLMDDLKHLYKTTGVNGKGAAFIFTDSEIKDEAFLEYMNNVLTSGEVSSLFARDEIDEICNDLRPIMKREFPRLPDTLENLYDYFISRVKNNLHVVLCFSPVGEKFRNRALKFPGLISGCTMDWFQRWPKEALVAVADYFLRSFDMVCTDEVKQSVVEQMGSVHDGVAEICTEYFNRFRRQAHVTPKSYLSFINSYKTVYAEKKTYIGNLADRMKMGLSKLIEASKSVAELAKELAVKEKELAVAAKKADEVLAEVTVQAQAAEKVKEAVQKKKEKAEIIVNAINADKEIAEKKLIAAKPALQEAERALDTIQPAHIATVRKLAKPPHLIMRIMDCVLLLRSLRLDTVTPDPDRPSIRPSWSESLKVMSKSDFLSSLQNFPKDSINEETIELLEPYMEAEDFNFDSAKKVCGDVAGLCSWSRAMVTFYSVNKEVLPLKANLAVQQHKLELAMSDLATAQAELDEKQRELDIVKAKYNAAVKEKSDLQDDADTCRRKMQAATALINGLGGEKERWTLQSKLFADQIGRLVGDVMLATAFLSYSGPFNQDFRSALLNKWQRELQRRKVPFSDDLNIISMLVDNATIGEWTLQGLPNDELSIQNGIIVTKATRYPLLIDPQGQGKKWIINRETPNQLQLSSLNNKYFRNHLEDCLSCGKPLLLEDIDEELDPVLDNVLERNFIKSGRTVKVKVGDKEVDVMDGFVLYITTKLSNPRYTPEISAKTAIIDFTVTIKGLEDQLLGRVILKEKNELETERTKLLEDVTANKKKMKELEDNLLLRLTSTKGSLVDDESLIDVLAVTKRTAEEVNDKLMVAAETELKINTAREEYRPVATRGSILYFLIVEMSMVNVMYQTSLQQFLGLFDESMTRSETSPIPNKRIQNIIDYLTFRVFQYTCRGLYEIHKFLFTLLLALKTDIQSGRVTSEEFQVFIKGGAALDMNTVQKKPCAWITDMTWLNIVELSKLPQFGEILNQVSRNEKGWKNWYDKDAPEEAQLPDGYQNTLDSFRRTLLVRSWCPDRTVNQSRKYIGDTLGKRFAEGVILDLERIWDESDQRTPMICLLSMGGDPTSAIEALSKKQKQETRAISMGQGQEVHARRLMQQFMQTGGWVLLQNCHLGLNFMDELLDTITTTETINENFRLWITTEEHPKFPIGLLQSGIKFTNEPPQGVKAGLKRTYNWVSQDMLDVNNLAMWKPMLYTVAFLHTTVQERRKFGPLGWNIPYEFNQADLLASVQFVQNHLDEVDPRKGISWNTVRYMIGEVQYGGRVTDDFDQRLLNTYTKTWFGDHMFADNFCFYKGYVIPVKKTIDEYRKFIEELPLIDSPEVFGLHPNADITYQTNMANSVLGTIVNIQPKESGGGGGETREAAVERLADDMLEKLPADYIRYEVKGALERQGGQTPMNIFLGQEIDRIQRVISVVRRTLKDLKLAIAGTIIMSDELRNALDSMYDARVPAAWQSVSWQSATLGFWFSDLVQRNAQFSSWLFEGRPHVFWMTGFFNPQGFLTAMRQEITRAHKGWALDSVQVHTEVLRQMKEDITSPPQEGVYIHGLFLEGAGWDRRSSRLVEPTPKVLYSTLPIIHVSAVNSTGAKDPRLYECPVYKKPRRTDQEYIFNVDLKSSQNPDHWILRGVALLCDTK